MTLDALDRSEPAIRPAGTSMVASLSDASIRQVRIVVMLSTGLASVLIGAAQFHSALSHPGPWEIPHGLAYMGTGVGCFMALILSYIRRIKTSEIVMLASAYLGTFCVIVTGASDSVFIIGTSACTVALFIPGVIIRINSAQTSALNLLCVWFLFVVSAALRTILHENGGIEEPRDIFIKILGPTMAFVTIWLMFRALSRRILESLAESERARLALRDSLEHQVALNDALLRFVPHEFLTSLGRQDLSEVRLGDSVTKTMSILFADVYGYTKLVEGMSPDATVRLLNDLFGVLEPAIHDHGGFVDSYIGDAIMALFDGPPGNAIDAALAMLAALERHNEIRRVAGQVPVAFGIGIHTGPVRLGTIGGPKRLKCSVFGDSVNLAARVEQLTRRYSTPLLVSGQTLGLVGEGHNYKTRIVDRVQVVGRTSSTSLFEVYDADSEPQRTHKQRIDQEYRAGIAAFYDQRFADALMAFERCLEIHDDAVLRTYIKRTRAHLERAPVEDWTGIEVLNQK